MARSTKDRIVDEALRLFAERGYAATSVAEIEAAAGLSPGAGGLYRHFTSKYEVLSSAVNHTAARTRDSVEDYLAKLTKTDLSLEERLAGVCQAGLTIVREERETIRVFFRDLSQFPELVAVVRRRLLTPMYDAVSQWFADQPEFAGSKADWQGVSVVLIGAIVHWHLFQETAGEPPGCADPSRFVTAWVDLARGMLPALR